MKILVVLVALLVAVAFAFIPARIAWHKHRSFGVWFAFGFFLFLPALIVALVISDRSFGDLAKNSWGDDWENVLAKQRQSPTDEGWYVDRSHEFTLRWWDGSAWANAWMRVDANPLTRPVGEEAWGPSEKFIREAWSSVEVAPQPV